MKKFRRLTALWICAVLCFCAACAAGEANDEPDMELIAQEEAAGVEVEGLAIDDEAEAAADDGAKPASIEGLKPLYVTVIKPFVSNGTQIRMRAHQSGDSEVVCIIKAGEPITVYAVYPAYVLAEYNGYVGYVIRTWVDENMVALDPQNTPPYGVVPSQYVATLTETANV